MLMGAIYLQHSNNPFSSRSINRIEFLSLVVGMMTVYIGLWYLSDSIGEETKILLFTIILYANLIFCIIWIIAYISSAEWA